MRIKPAIAWLMVVTLCALSAACGSSSSKSSVGQTSASKSPVTFALISYKIPGSDSLTELSAGANAAANQINATGGFGGRRVVIATCNSMLQPAAATVCAHKTLAEHPVAMFGCELSWSAAGLAVYAAAGIPSVNCPDTTADFNNPWTFGLNSSAVGQQRGAARYVCTRSDVHKVVALFPNVPQIVISQQLAYQTLQGCGKQTATPVFYPLTAVDVSPYVTRVAQAKPDFVLLTGIGAQIVLLFKALQQAGIPPSHVIAPDIEFVYSTILKQAGSAMNGAYAENQFDTWGDTTNPDVAAYLTAFKGSSVDPRDPTVAWGYSDVMWFYTAAKAIGFDKFNSASLTTFMRTQTNVHIPLSRSLINPGPKGFPQERQPYIQISQWKNGRMVVVPTGPNKDGWVYGY
jgi:branched-chain amino acid transport system substrate-binding protein